MMFYLSLTFLELGLVEKHYMQSFPFITNTAEEGGRAAEVSFKEKSTDWKFSAEQEVIQDSGHWKVGGV